MMFTIKKTMTMTLSLSMKRRGKGSLYQVTETQLTSADCLAYVYVTWIFFVYRSHLVGIPEELVGWKTRL